MDSDFDDEGGKRPRTPSQRRRDRADEAERGTFRKQPLEVTLAEMNRITQREISAAFRSADLFSYLRQKR